MASTLPSGRREPGPRPGPSIRAAASAGSCPAATDSAAGEPEPNEPGRRWSRGQPPARSARAGTCAYGQFTTPSEHPAKPGGGWEASQALSVKRQPQSDQLAAAAPYSVFSCRRHSPLLIAYIYCYGRVWIFISATPESSPPAE